MKLSVIVITVAVMSAWIGVSEAQQAGTVKRLHVLDCGRLHLQDGGRVSPAGAGAPIDLLDSCYLIQTAQGYLLWETGAPDGLVAQPAPGGTPLVLSRTETLLSQLAELDVEPSDLRYVAISHTHGDHAGNVDLFPEVTLLIQKAEYEAAFAPDRNNPPFSPNRPVEQVEGDRDVFGDGSVTLISTPGHTSGHQSLLVNLEETGWVVLAGDATQVKEQWDRWHASPEGYAEGLAPSMQRLADVVSEHQAQVWFSHDLVQTNELRSASPFE